MAITVAPFGVDALERRVDKITMTNKRGHSVSVINYGAAVQSMVVTDRQGRLVDICLGFDTLGDYQSPQNACLGATCGRVCNRIGGAQFDLNGQTYELTANEGRNTLHGGRHGFDKAWWVYETREGNTADFINLHYHAHHLEEGFPGRLHTQVVYSFSDDDVLTVSYLAQSDADTLVNLTNHTYFNLNGSGTCLDHVLHIPAAQIAEKDQESIPTGRLMDIAGTPFDFAVPAPLHTVVDRLDEHPTLARDQGLDVSYDVPGEGLRLAAEVFSPQTGIRLTVHTTQPAVQAFMGQCLNAVGKGGTVYSKYAGLALETQHHPDAIHHEAFDPIVLKANEPYHQVTTWTVKCE